MAQFSKALFSPVSYTHLDVYKRQQLDNLHPEAAGIALTSRGAIAVNEQLNEMCIRDR